MTQSLTQLPKDATFRIAGWTIIIRNHEVMYIHGLIGEMMNIIHVGESDRDTLYQFEKHGISFEMAIEYCAKELEENSDVLKLFISRYYDMCDSISLDVGFSKSDAGRIIAGQFVEKIRSCDNWEELYNELHLTSMFQKEMKNKIKREMEQQCRKV